jgi:hypothetical protein
MRVSSLKVMCLATLVAAGGYAAACGGDDNTGAIDSGTTTGSSTGTTTASTTTGTTTSGTTTAGTTTGGATTSGTTTAGTTTGGTSGTTTAGTTTGGATTGSATGGDAGGVVCPDGLEDKMTACTATTVACTKGCGPDLSGGGTLGQKTCTCNQGTMVYNCADCVYETPLPACYMPAATVPACAAGTADKASCTTICAGTASGICTITTDAGKTDGCVCVMGASAPQWTCQTQWW